MGPVIAALGDEGVLSGAPIAGGARGGAVAGVDVLRALGSGSLMDLDWAVETGGRLDDDVFVGGSVRGVACSPVGGGDFRESDLHNACRRLLLLAMMESVAR